MSAHALRFLILTAARTGEILGAAWSEIEGDLWVVPGERMKAGRAHKVPLNDMSLSVLNDVRGLSDTYIFGGQRPGKPMSNMAMEHVLRRMDVKKYGVTVHGFRSSFRDWVSEATSFQAEVAEHALAHTVSNKTEAAYARSTLLDKRRSLMTAWAEHVTGG